MIGPADGTSFDKHDPVTDVFAVVSSRSSMRTTGPPTRNRGTASAIRSRSCSEKKLGDDVDVLEEHFPEVYEMIVEAVCDRGFE
ncbi:hypothetical protein [Halomontanus rarus]|uniref:hypothetical protein n=1 Tax=Halomontanus rarus TaxID=3034020 RepID=UPI001A982F69